MQKSLALDYNSYVPIHELQSQILSYLLHNEDKFSSYHEGDISKDTEAFFRTGNYCQSIVDIIVQCAPDALKTNMYIYQKGSEDRLLIQEFLVNDSSPTVHLYFEYTPNCDVGNHYMPIVKISSIPVTPAKSFTPPTHSQVNWDSENSSQSSQSQTDEMEILESKDYRFPTHYFIGLTPTLVDYLPGDINGKKLYKIPATSKNCWKVSSDLRNFKMNSSGRKGLIGKRKVGVCMGHTVCNNDACTYRSTNTDKQRNVHNWQYLEGMKVCKHCGGWGTVVACTARKLVEFDQVENTVTVYHIGIHSCVPKKDNKKYDSTMTEALSQNMGLGPAAVKRKKVGEAVEKGEINSAFNIAEKYHTGRMKYLKRKLVVENNPNQHSFEAVALFKKTVDARDPFLIYRVNDGNMNDMPDFVFKTSKEMLLLAHQMNQGGPDNPLKDEVVYFDGSHSRCTGFITLGLFFLHPGMRSLLRLCSMEVRSEGTKNISFFWRNLNNALREATDEPDTMFNPCNIMVDENGANFCGVKEVFGLDYCLEKVTSCQLHFKKDILKHLHKVGESYRDQFWKDAIELCVAETVGRFNEIKALLDEYVDLFPKIKPCLEWYYARKYHLFPAFRRFNYSGVTLAESGNAQIKRSTKLWLLDAAKDDTTTMIIQCSNLRLYNEQNEDVIGGAPTQAQTASKARAQQLKMASAYAAEFSDPTQMQQNLDEHVSPGVFIPGRNSKHKVGRGSSIQGSFLSTGDERGRGRGSRGRGSRGKGKGRGKSSNPNMASEIDRILNRSEELLKQNEPETEYDIPDNSRGYNTKNNPPQVCLFLGLPISRCQGCRGIIDKDCKPRDMCLRIEDYRSYTDPKTKKVKTTYGNIYFHLDLKCLQRKYPQALLEHIVISDDTLSLLSEGNLKYLKATGFLETVVANKRKEKGKK